MKGINIVKEEDTTNVYTEKESHKYLESKKNNVKSLCRICLSGDSVYLTSLIACQQLAEKYTFISSIPVILDDGLPLNVCNKCEEQLINCYLFKQRCEQSYLTVKSWLKLVVEESQKRTKRKDEKGSVKNYEHSEVTKPKEEAGIKNEEEVHLDVEYLEDFSDIDQNSNEFDKINSNEDFEEKKPFINLLENKKYSKRKKVEISVTDAKSVFKEIAVKSIKRKQKTYDCDVCSQKFHQAKLLILHINQNHDVEKPQNPYSCDKCMDSFMNQHDLHLHSALHSEDSCWKCNKCNKEFNTRGTLRRHVARHMQQKRFACERCGKRFVELYALRRHLRVHTGQRAARPHGCDVCHKMYKFPSPSQLAAHRAGHAAPGARPCACACGKRFPSARLLASHQLVHSDTKPYCCSYCDKRFRHESTRNTHHRTHTGEKPYVCSTCGKRFIQNSNLTLHMRTHTGERPYKCETCSQKFSTGSALKNHLHIHTGEKPYCCTICGKRFARKGMTAHCMRIHTGERPFECSVCLKKFFTKARMKEHSRMHSGDRPFGCAKCSQKFASRSYLIKHLKTHDANKTNTIDIKILKTKRHFSHVNDMPNKVSKISVKTDKQKSISNKSNHSAAISLEETLDDSQELVIEENNTEKNVIDAKNTQNNVLPQGNVSSGAKFDVKEENYARDVNDVMTGNEGEVNITSMLEGTTVQLYQVDQSLVQIHSAGGQVTISKITSKMTANF